MRMLKAQSLDLNFPLIIGQLRRINYNGYDVGNENNENGNIIIKKLLIRFYPL